MVSKVIIGLFFVLATLGAQAQYSAARAPHESWQQARARTSFFNAFTYVKKTGGSKTAYDSSTKYTSLNIQKIPEFGVSAADTQNIFEDIRNKRFLTDPQDASLKRRISWLYPYDGCFARAEEVSHLLTQNYPKTAYSRVFIFGDLNVKTLNSSSGEVSWWYHVAVIIRLKNKAYVIDPSLDVTTPIELSAWIQLMVPNLDDPYLSICSGHTYVPDSDCATAADMSEADAYQAISTYLRSERSNLKSLGRDAKAELGDNPPW